MKKFKNYLYCLVPLLCTLLIHLVVMFLAKLINGLILTIQEINEKNIDFDLTILNRNMEIGPQLNEIMLIVAAAICIICFGWYFKRNKVEATQPVREILSVKLFLLLIILGISLQFLNFIMLSFIFSSDSSLTLQPEPIRSIDIITLVFEGLFAPVSDELIFRGVILSKCRKYMPFAAANIFQSVMFGIYHMNPIQGLYAFMMGLFLGYVMKHFNSIVVPIILHMIINISGNLAVFIPANLVPTESPIYLVIGIALIAACMVGIEKCKRIAKE